MTFLKQHWFGALISLLLAFYTIVFTLVIISPKDDLQRRGFISCTDDFVLETSACDGSMCMISAVINNNFCNVHIIFSGLSSWIKGEQATPWSNYLFTPEIEDSEYEDDIELMEYYKNSPELREELEQLIKLNKELENNDTSILELE